VAAALDQHRMPVGGPVELGRGGHPALRQVQLLPVGGRANPLALRSDRGPLPDQIQEPRDRSGLVDRDVVRIESGEDQVGVGVVEGGKYGRPGQVLDRGSPGHPVIEAVRLAGQGDDAVAAHRKGPLGRLPWHQRVHRRSPDQ
jgi:hypothetical protein